MSIKLLNNSNVKFSFALSQTFNAFIKKWPNKYDKTIMIETWANVASDERITVRHIRMVTDYCVENLKCWPSVYKFKTYCERAANNESLSEPVITKAEEIAYEILNDLSKNKHHQKDLRSFTEALLIAALVFHRLTYQELNFSYDKLAIEEVSLKFAMLIKEMPEWMETANKDENFWLAKILKQINISKKE